MVVVEIVFVEVCVLYVVGNGLVVELVVVVMVVVLNVVVVEVVVLCVDWGLFVCKFVVVVVWLVVKFVGVLCGNVVC